jgi:catechol 2,3-dioxygenase-like lactoylglutathione lyase family enzyme
MAGRKSQPKTKRPAPKAAERRPKPRQEAARPAPRGSATRPAGPLFDGIERLHQVAMTATNLDASVAFYRDVVGLKFIARFDPPGLAFFSLGGGTRLMLSAGSSSATLYFLVDDVKTAYADYHKRGINFLQPPAMIHRDEAGQFGKRGNEEWMAFFKDPSGNTLALVEKRQ